MKIGFFGLDLPEGKTKYEDPQMKALEEKCNPKKVSPYYAELIPEEAVDVDAILSNPDALLDVLINDMEKCEMRIERTESESEKALMQRCMELLESEKPLCNETFTPEEMELLRSVQMVSLKPVIVAPDGTDTSELIRSAFDAAGMVFFYTAGPEEVHAWDIAKDSELVECAGKIHSDLARGFIKADVVTLEDFLAAHSFKDCMKNGTAKVVERDHKITSGDIIEIRFNV